MDGSPVGRDPENDPAPPPGRSAPQRLAWFDAYTAQRNVLAPAGDALFSCPCCGHATLSERGGYEICGNCGWEDDGQDEHGSAVIRGGPNGRLSLDAARAEYVANGGIRQVHRPPGDPV